MAEFAAYTARKVALEFLFFLYSLEFLSFSGQLDEARNNRVPSRFQRAQKVTLDFLSFGHTLRRQLWSKEVLVPKSLALFALLWGLLTSLPALAQDDPDFDAWEAAEEPEAVAEEPGEEQADWNEDAGGQDEAAQDAEAVAEEPGEEQADWSEGAGGQDEAVPDAEAGADGSDDAHAESGQGADEDGWAEFEADATAGLGSDDSEVTEESAANNEPDAPDAERVAENFAEDDTGGAMSNADPIAEALAAISAKVGEAGLTEVSSHQSSLTNGAKESIDLDIEANTVIRVIAFCDEKECSDFKMDYYDDKGALVPYFNEPTGNGSNIGEVGEGTLLSLVSILMTGMDNVPNTMRVRDLRLPQSARIRVDLSLTCTNEPCQFGIYAFRLH
jgi:hypothetical protein